MSVKASKLGQPGAGDLGALLALPSATTRRQAGECERRSRCGALLALPPQPTRRQPASASVGHAAEPGGQPSDPFPSRTRDPGLSTRAQLTPDHHGSSAINIKARDPQTSSTRVDDKSVIDDTT